MQAIKGSILTNLCISAPVSMLSGIYSLPYIVLNFDIDRGDTILLRDLLAIHMIRKRDQSTIITYHPSPEAGRTSAKKLHSRVHLAGKSVYWTNIFKQSTDPTFVLLTILWHALYSWDEALSSLYEHITDQVSIFMAVELLDVTVSDLCRSPQWLTQKTRTLRKEPKVSFR